MRLSFLAGLMMCLQALVSLPLARASDFFQAPLMPGEQLTYMVEFMSMRIAKVEFSVMPPVDTLGMKLHHVRAEIHTLMRLPFFYAEDRYDSYFDADYRPVLYTGTGKRKNYTFRLYMFVDYEKRQVYAVEYRSQGREERVHWEYQEPLQETIYDHLTLFYYVRSKLHQLMIDTGLELPILANGKIKRIHFKPKAGVKSVRFGEQSMETVPLNVRLGFKTLAGLREIKFFLSSDDRSLPLKGFLSFMVGKANISLVEYSVGRFPFVQAAESTGSGGK